MLGKTKQKKKNLVKVTILVGQNVWSLGGAINFSTCCGAFAFLTIRGNVTFKEKAVSFIYIFEYQRSRANIRL